MTVLPLILVLAASLPALFATPIPAPGSGCAAVHVITTRASTELPGEGITGPVVDRIVSQSRQTVSRSAVDYPALLVPYLTSQAAGVAALRGDLASQVARCPNQKIVLLGYSQGAHVSGDILETRATGINNVAAVVLFGDPAHIRGESFQKGSGNLVQGLFPRSSGALEPFAARLASFCDFGDLFCASGTSTAIHLAYIDKYGTDAVNFVLSHIGG